MANPLGDYIPALRYGVSLVQSNEIQGITGQLTTGGSLQVSGAFAGTFRFSAATNVGFPTSGTLTTLAGTETFTNKTLTSPTITGATITTPTLGAGLKESVTTLTAGTTLTTSHSPVILIGNKDATITLPVASTAGLLYTIVKTATSTAGSTVTIAAAANDAVNGAASIAGTSKYWVRVLQADGGTTWYIIAGQDGAAG